MLSMLFKNTMVRNAGCSFAKKAKGRIRGFTILELMISIGTLGVITAIAAPSLAEFYDRQKIASQAESIGSALSLARSTALSEALTTQVCWNKGSNVKTVAGYAIASGNMAVLVANPVPGGDAKAVADIAYSDSLFVDDDEADGCATFTTQGRLDTDTVGDLSLIFGVCRKSGDTEGSRSIIVTQTGRASVAKNVSAGGTATIDCS